MSSVSETAASSAATAPAGYQVRPFRPDDAAGIVACFRKIYGDSYVHPELYDERAICELNETGRLASFVSIGPCGSIVGHYGLERPNLGRIAETGEALVLPEHRHHALMESMRALLEERAREVGLAGLYGNVVTNHVFSQRVVERFGELPTAVNLGWSPRTFHNMAQDLAQRMSELIYFKHLAQPSEREVHLPERHRSWCLRIYELLGVPVRERRVPASDDAAAASDAAASSPTMKHDVRPDLQRAVVRVESIGPETVAELRAAVASYQAEGVEVIYVDLPLAHAGTPELCDDVEALGFFFGGLCPLFAETGDTLRLQWLGVELDETQIQIESPIARELLAYVAAERRRVS